MYDAKISNDSLAIIYQTINGCVGEQSDKGKSPAEIQAHLHGYLLALLLKRKVKINTPTEGNNGQVTRDEKCENADEDTLDHLSEDESIEVRLRKRENESKKSEHESEGSNSTILIVIVALLALLVIGGAVTAIIINHKNNTTPSSITKDVEDSKSAAKQSENTEKASQSTPEKKSVSLKLMAIEKVIQENHSSGDNSSFVEKAFAVAKERKLKQSYSVGAILKQKEAERTIFESENQRLDKPQSVKGTGLSSSDNQDDHALIDNQPMHKRILL